MEDSWCCGTAESWILHSQIHTETSLFQAPMWTSCTIWKVIKVKHLISQNSWHASLLSTMNLSCHRIRRMPARRGFENPQALLSLLCLTIKDCGSRQGPIQLSACAFRVWMHRGWSSIVLIVIQKKIWRYWMVDTIVACFPKHSKASPAGQTENCSHRCESTALQLRCRYSAAIAASCLCILKTLPRHLWQCHTWRIWPRHP